MCLSPIPYISAINYIQKHIRSITIINKLVSPDEMKTVYKKEYKNEMKTVYKKEYKNEMKAVHEKEYKKL